MGVGVDILVFEEAPVGGGSAPAGGELAAQPPPAQLPPAEVISPAFQVVYDVDLDKPVRLDQQLALFPELESWS